MGRKDSFIKGFEEKLAANPWGWLRPLKRLKAMGRLRGQKFKKSEQAKMRLGGSKDSPKTMSDKAKAKYEDIKRKASSPSTKAKKALGWGLIGAAPIAYGAHKLTEDPKVERVQHDPYGIGGY